MPRYRLIKLPNAEVVLRLKTGDRRKETTYHLLTWQKSGQIGPIIPKPLNVSGHFTGDFLDLNHQPSGWSGWNLPWEEQHVSMGLVWYTGESMEVVEKCLQDFCYFPTAIVLMVAILQLSLVGLSHYLHGFWFFLYIPGVFFGISEPPTVLTRNNLLRLYQPS